MPFLDAKKISDQYRKQDCLWGLEPNKFVKKIPFLIKSGAVLDIGVGEGRNSLFLAKNGFDVLGIDVSEEAVKKYLTFAGERKIDVKGMVLDALHFKFDKEYEIIISVATLHLVQKDRVIDLIKTIKGNTKKGGINLLTVFTNKDIGQKEFPNLYFFSEDELMELYSDWEIIEYTNYKKEETHGKRHLHHICAIIARK